MMLLPNKTFAIALAGAGSFFLAHPAQAAPLTAEGFQQKIVGKTLVAKRFGMSVTIRYKADGTVQIETPRGPGGGTWSASGDKICVKITSGPRTGSNCGQVEDLGNGKFRNPRGQVVTVQAGS